jgi:uncharacterized membrane protein
MPIIKKIKNFFFSGILIILPITITVYIVYIILNFVFKIIDFINKYCVFLKINNIPHSELLNIIIIIILIGSIIHYANLEPQIQKIEKKIIQNIPIINLIYNGIKKITLLLNNNTKKTEISNKNTIAWVKLPKLNIYSIGIVIGELEKKHSPDEKKYFSLFIPTTPNPMTGYYIIAAENEFIINNMTREEAISIIISGGIIRPE